MLELKGDLNISRDAKLAIVVGEFNTFIGQQLLSGALDTFVKCGISKNNVTVAWVPGAFEIPLAAKKLAESGQYAAVVCLGAVIRGATPHFDYVAGQAASGVAQVALDTGIPVIFSVLTTDTVEQAIERSGCKAGNKGAEGAQAAVEMVSLLGKLGPADRHATAGLASKKTASV